MWNGRVSLLLRLDLREILKERPKELDESYGYVEGSVPWTSTEIVV